MERRSLFMTPLYVYKPDPSMNIFDSLDTRRPLFWQHIETALRQDNKDLFVSLINSLTCKNALPSPVIYQLFAFDAVDCAAAVLDGATAGMLNLTTDLSHVGSDALIVAAQFYAPRIIDLLLKSGFVVDGYLKDAHPLNEALKTTWSQFNAWNAHIRTSAVHLVTKLCSENQRRLLETLRLLAYKTKEIRYEFIYHLKEGHMPEVGSLLLVASELLVSPSTSEEEFFDVKSLVEMSHFVGTNKPGLKNTKMEKELLTLLAIFDKIGDKLAAYIRLDQPRHDDHNLEIASLLEDAGFHVSAKDICRCPPEVYSLGSRRWGGPIERNSELDPDPVGECHKRIPESMQLMPSWWMRNKTLPSLDRKLNNSAPLSRCLYHTKPSRNTNMACYSPNKRWTDLVQRYATENQFAFLAAALKKGLRH